MGGAAQSRIRSIGAALALLAAAPGLQACADALAAPEGALAPGERMRALAVGVDSYKTLHVLRGAVADARDIAGTLRKAGNQDVTVLTEAKASRRATLDALAQLVARTQAGEVVVIAFAGLAARMARPDGDQGNGPGESVYLLAGYDAKDAAGRQEKLIDAEFSHVVRQIEAKGARALLVLDACAASGEARETDPRGAPLVLRSAKAAAAPDGTTPVSDAEDARATPGPFSRSTVLLACDEGSSAPEILAPGRGAWRGALSYAVARALEGFGDANRDGEVSEDELLRYVRQVAYQLSEQRQIVLSFEAAGSAAAAEAASTAQRRILVVPKGGATPGVSDAQPASRPAAAVATIRMASTGDTSLLANLSSSAVLVQPVGLRNDPDLVWDPGTGDVLSGSDVIASRLSAERLRGAVERTVAIRKLKQLSVQAPESVRLLPNDKLHRRGAVLSAQIDAGSRTSVVVFNIAGDGTVQLLFPRSRDPRRAPMPFNLPKIEVQPPFGSDTMVVIAAEENLTGLEQAIASLDNRQLPIQAAEIVERLMPSAARLGLVSLFTAP